MNDKYAKMLEEAEMSAAVTSPESMCDIPDFRIVQAITDPDKLPELPAQLIEGIVYRGGKVLVAGASKSGKSWLLIELAMAVATGSEWIGYQCAKGRVLFINLEIPEPQFMRRVYRIVDELSLDRNVVQSNLDIANLRGKVSDIAVLVDVLLEKISEGTYDLVIVDPAYKVQPGSENEAESITRFCNQLDRLASGLGCSIAYSHHHPKGSQAGRKALDRASGSGVFARDADAIVDMIELEQDEAVYEAKRVLNWHDAIPFRIEVAVRDFKMPAPKGIWFKHPVHEVDATGVLNGCKVRNEGSSKVDKEEERERKLSKMESQLDVFMGERDEIDRKEFVAHCGNDARTVNKYVNQSSLFELDSGASSAIIRRVKAG